MASVRKRLREVYAALDAASSYSEWLVAARAHDDLSGAAAWREDDRSDHYDAESLRSSIESMRALRVAGQGLELARSLTEDLFRHLGDLSAPDLYDTAMAGSKRLVERYLAEATASLRWLAESPPPELSRRETLRRFEAAWKVFGRSALLLSGGATWGFYHLGVVKALFEHGVLPHILSGASTGAMVAAGVCTRDDDDLAAMYADTDQIRLDGLVPAGPRRALSSGAWLAPEALYEVLLHNVGGYTFAEARARSGRALNISVSPTRTRQKPRLLNWMTAPDVLVARAALASSALPGLFPPIQLTARGAEGGERPYIPGERWVDGSLHSDLPKRRLARLHNVNHFIVSQANPHVLPFVRHHGRRGLAPALAGLAGATVRSQGVMAADIARRAARSAGPVGQLADQAYALVSQDYRGDIDIHPRFRWGLFRKVVQNPTRDDLALFIREGERAVWPRLAMIRDQTTIGRTFRTCVERLRAPPASATYPPAPYPPATYPPAP